MLVPPLFYLKHAEHIWDGKAMLCYHCRYAVTHGTFPLTSQFWEEGDVHEQGSTRDSAQIADTAIR